ncbi:LarC family nickel insertion protein [Labrenzia sp. PHM005]|uniref:LarC family nickel insertion protein n=1 Tax=Labrenzia sp. PHM005 TaxID=2590016 RepID=UPI00113FE3DE|nr:LarC family nickel insertion protein [Labrenzia sp. PHM005]QDG75397.1 LarC family nickel insertion protein [Labrenzia sp. PHM005]
MHIHLDLVGGLSGDMFAGALLDMRPGLEPLVQNAIASLPLNKPGRVWRESRGDGVLTGSGLGIECQDAALGHAHTHFKDIRCLLETSGLAANVHSRALDIFCLLAKAEAQVHGVSVDKVAFHEVGALDSIIDIVAAAVLIDALSPASWSCSPVPVGSGRVKTQHGILPIPAPATLILLSGLPVFDDGVPGERITPTGAAILAHLQPGTGWPENPTHLQHSGTGFGTRKLDTIPNIVRAIQLGSMNAPQRETIVQLAFEIDDQTPEDLAAGLDEIRQTQGVRDVMSVPIVGKKGRQASGIRILCDLPDEHMVTQACFAQTTTLAVRRHILERTTLMRKEAFFDGIGVKLAERPGGVLTVKAEMDDLKANGNNHAERQALSDSARLNAVRDVAGLNK